MGHRRRKGLWRELERRVLFGPAGQLAGVVTYPFYRALLRPLAGALPRRDRYWVVGGHRGRLYADNAAALHAHLVKDGSHEVYWVTGSRDVYERMEDEGLPVLRRNALSTRWLLARAEVLVYSHGEDDLDLFMILERSHPALRIFVNHSMNHLKGGQHFRGDVARLGPLRRALFDWLVTDFDYLLASSETERRNFALSYPGREGDIVLGGGAHIDELLRRADEPVSNRVLWFPTFRDTAAGRSGLDEMIRRVAGHQGIAEWLEEQGLVLQICAHINARGARGLAPLRAASGRVETIRPSEATRALATCRLFISDYSGMLADYLLFDRPVIFFAFDLEPYRSERNLYVDYESFAYGPLARSLDDLVEVLRSGRWERLEAFRETRERWRTLFFPSLEPVYSESTRLAIERLLAENAQTDGARHSWSARAEALLGYLEKRTR